MTLLPLYWNPDKDAECCCGCGEAFKEGDMIYPRELTGVVCVHYRKGCAKLYNEMDEPNKMTCNQVHLPHCTSSRVEKCGCQVDGILESAGLLAFYPAMDADYYLRRGHWVDEKCAIIAQGKQLSELDIIDGEQDRVKPMSKKEETERWIDYVHQFGLWVRLHKIVFVAAQQPVTLVDDGVVGTYDLLLEVDGYLTMIDIKCGSIPKATRLQTAIYNIGIGMRAQKRLGLLLLPGKFEEHWYDDPADYNDARILMRAYHIKGKYA